MILVAYRHGLRASEICELRWDDIDLRAAAMHVKRPKARPGPSHEQCAVRCLYLRLDPAPVVCHLLL